jgi:hypothetical protein
MKKKLNDVNPQQLSPHLPEYWKAIRINWQAGS